MESNLFSVTAFGHNSHPCWENVRTYLQYPLHAAGAYSLVAPVACVVFSDACDRRQPEPTVAVSNPAEVFLTFDIEMSADMRVGGSGAGRDYGAVIGPGTKLAPGGRAGMPGATWTTLTGATPAVGGYIDM
jgi:hypothetical protein